MFDRSTYRFYARAQCRLTQSEGDTLAAWAEPPSDAPILTAVHGQYGLRLTRLSLLALGYDELARRCRAETAEGVAWFLKLRRGGPQPAALFAPGKIVSVIGT